MNRTRISLNGLSLPFGGLFGQGVIIRAIYANGAGHSIVIKGRAKNDYNEI